jgi:uncharacterized membrane protein
MNITNAGQRNEGRALTLISVIAPHFVSSRPADLLSLAITLLVASRLCVLPTILIGVGSAGLLRHLLA